MTKKTIMEQLTETDKKAEIKGHYCMDCLFSRAMDDANELHFESIEQHVAVHTLDALERIANALEKGQEKDSDGQTLTYHDFFKTFNENGDYYRACKSNRGGVDIISTEDGELKASLLPHTNAWYFKESGFYDNELILMAQLAATAPELRGEIDNE